jgi:hypothetical protein
LGASEKRACTAYGDNHKVHMAPGTSEFLQKRLVFIKFGLVFLVAAEVGTEANFDQNKGALGAIKDGKGRVIHVWNIDAKHEIRCDALTACA